MLRLVIPLTLCIILPVVALATPYVPFGEASKATSDDHWIGMSAMPPSTFDYEYDPLARFQMAADFITTLQVSDTSLAAYGGMREGEHMLSVIQTDNTSESIWMWSHYYSLTGEDTYRSNIDAAWHYCMNNPAFNEEGGDHWVTGYYRRYNCAWALRAEMEYRLVYGDTSYAWYGDSCASYLCHNPLRITYPVGVARRLNGLIMGWAVGNLYEYGLFTGNPVYTSKAVDMADSLKAWVEANPAKFHWMEWAMEGGSVMWGLVHSWFREYPAGQETWVGSMGPNLAAEIDSSQYQNAWRGWAALGQRTAAEVLATPLHIGYFEHLADTLVLNDGDLDGGIPVIDAEPDDHDQSWVTNYMGFMCMDGLITMAGLASQDARGDFSPGAIVTPLPAQAPPDIKFTLAGPSRVRVEVYDVAGRCVDRRDLGVLAAGPHAVPAFSRREIPASAGVYFYALQMGTDVAKGKIVMLR